MKNLREVLNHSEEIVSLAKRFSFDSAVRILCEEASVKGNKTLLNFLVRVAPGKEITIYNSTYLSMKLTEILGCYVLITLHEGVEELYKDMVERRSLPMNATEGEFCKLFGVKSVENIFFEKSSKHVEVVLLKKANQYLDEHPLEEVDSSNDEKKSESFSRYSMLTQATEREQKKYKPDTGDSDSPNQGSTESPRKSRGLGSSKK